MTGLRLVTKVGAAAVIACAFASPGWGEGEVVPGGPPAGDAVEVTAAQRDAAIVKAAAFLDEELWKRQDGGSPQKQYAAGVAGWAYVLLSSKPPQGLPPRMKQIDRIADYLGQYEGVVEDHYDDPKGRKKKEQPPAPPAPGMGQMPGDTSQFVWPLSQDAHFRAECAARGLRNKETRESLRKIVRILEGSQQGDGGWGHDDASKPGAGLPTINIPLPGGKSITYPKTLLATSHCALAALGAAHRALGTKTPSKAIEKGRAYFGTCQQGCGTFPYDPSQKSDAAVTFDTEKQSVSCIDTARTGGAAFALLLSGPAAPGTPDPLLTRALKAIEKFPNELGEGHGSATLSLEYGALVSRARGPAAWAEFRRIYYPRIVAGQQADGSFKCVCTKMSGATTCDSEPPIPALAEGEFGMGTKVYITAVELLVLALDRDVPKSVPLVPQAGPTTPSDK